MIAAYEGQRVHSAMIDALVAQEIKRQNAELARSHAAEVRAAGQDGYAPALLPEGQAPAAPRWHPGMRAGWSRLPEAAEARLLYTMMRPAYSRYWAREIRRARRKYGHNPEPSRLARALVGVWALIVLEVTGWKEMLAAWNRAA